MDSDKTVIKKFNLKETQKMFKYFQNDYKLISQAVQIRGEKLFVMRNISNLPSENNNSEINESLSVILEASGQKRGNSQSRNYDIHPYGSFHCTSLATREIKSGIRRKLYSPAPKSGKSYQNINIQE